MRFKFEDKVFAYRIAGVATHEGRVLLHRAEMDSFWALPGGSCEFAECSKSALQRELKEELNAETEVGNLLWIVENFFEYDGKKWHEIGLYYHFEFKGSSKDLYGKDEFKGIESDVKGRDAIKLYFKWVPMADLNSMEIKPDFLKKALTQIPASAQAILNR